MAESLILDNFILKVIDSELQSQQCFFINHSFKSNCLHDVNKTQVFVPPYAFRSSFHAMKKSTPRKLMAKNVYHKYVY